MISLRVKNYCSNCPEFEPDVKKNAYRFNPTDDPVYYMTDIYCEHKDRCESMLKYLTEIERDKKEMIKFIKQLLCKHESELNRWHICHGPNAMDPAEIEAEYICSKCGKVSYGHYNISCISEFKKICKQHERRLR